LFVQLLLDNKRKKKERKLAGSLNNKKKKKEGMLVQTNCSNHIDGQIMAAATTSAKNEN
jgi:hypothetical protein